MLIIPALSGVIQVLVREGAAEAMGACLQIISQRERQMGTQAYETIYEEAERGLKMNTVEAIHGSLMAVQELLQHSKTVGIFCCAFHLCLRNFR